jgi:hypothetical protein
MLHGQHFVHAFEAQTAFPIQEVGDVGLLEFGLLGEMKPGQFACIDTLPQDLRRLSCGILNFMARSIAPAYSLALSGKDFHKAALVYRP